MIQEFAPHRVQCRFWCIGGRGRAFGYSAMRPQIGRAMKCLELEEFRAAHNRRGLHEAPVTDDSPPDAPESKV
jgi:hypothetical protein